MPFHVSTATAKAALEGLTRSLAAEFAGSGVRFNAIAPSLTDTPLAASMLSNEKRRQNIADRNPMGRIGDPDQIAALAAHLLSEEAAWITGQVIGIDGGMSSVRA
jgi:NAD(P)-dependent dehydrogenase (short-subunit alcohol dehydrogenase family)